jgi:hypothetical protein
MDELGDNSMKQRKALRRRVLVFLAVVFFAACLLIVSFIIALKVTTSKMEYAHWDGAEQEDFDDDSFESRGKWYGLCKKNSIHSVDDFRTAVSSDQVLKIHYADFRWDNARMERLDKAMLAYVYFRKDDKIFVKKKPIRLPDGDAYITDGNKRVRTHCCNNYTPGPPLYESSDLLAEPSAGLLALNTPEQTSPLTPSPMVENVPKQPEDTPPINILPPGHSEAETTIVPQPYPTPTSIIQGGSDGDGDGGGGGGGGGGGTKSVPEAATILLVGMGVAVSFIVLFIVNYSNRRSKTPGRKT